MTSTVDSQLADHHARIVNLEDREKETSRKLDWVIGLIITTLIAAVVGLLKK